MTSASPEIAADRAGSIRALDAVRGGAALLVVLGHVRYVLYAAMHLPRPHGPAAVLLVPASLGQEAVAVFFVLSGYLVGGQVLRQVDGGRFRPREYAAKRLSRLWTVLLPGLALTALLDLGSRRWASGTYEDLTHGHDLGLVACNAAFLQRLRCSTFGTNDALWSLAYEFWFYVLFPAALIAFVQGGRRAGWVAALVFVAAVAVAGLDVLALGLSWLVGVGVAVLQGRGSGEGLGRGRSLLAVLGVLGLAMAASSALDAGLAIRFALVTPPAAALVLGLAQRRSLPAPQWAWGSVSRVGPWSYSLYVFHLPLVILVVGGPIAARGWGEAVRIPATYLLAAALALACWPLYWLTERHTPLVRRVILPSQRPRSDGDDGLPRRA